jgi:hypothetical protein
MNLRTITPQEARKAAKTADPSQVREMGYHLMLRGACWETHSLGIIAKTLGDTGICAAFDADNMQEAAWNMAKLTRYRERNYVHCWTTPKFGSLWIELCKQNPGQLPAMFGHTKETLWDCIANMEEGDYARAHDIAPATQVGLGAPEASSIGSLLGFASIHRKSQMWQAILDTIVLERLGETTLNKADEPVPVLAGVLAYGGVLGKKKIDNILIRLETNTSLVETLSPHRFQLCMAAIQSANVACLKQVKAWDKNNDWPRHPTKGTSLLEAGLLLREFPGTLKKKWNGLDAVGAKNPKKMTRALSDPTVFSTLMDYAGQLGDEHCFEVLRRAHQVGVDLLSINGPDGKDIIASMRNRQSMMADRIQALVEHHTLGRQTPSIPASTAPRRRM